jgi:hypothetical protein
MSTKRIPLLTYLSVRKQADGHITLDDERLCFIRIKFKELYQDNDIDDDDLRHEILQKLIQQLQINDDQISLEYLDLCVKEKSNDDAKIEILDKFRGSAQHLEPTPAIEPKKFKKHTSNTQPLEDKTVSLNKIICIVHRKLDRPEVNEFMRDFLFRQVQTEENQTSR